jgi:cytochrome c553
MKHFGSIIAALTILLISAGPLLAQEDPQFRILADGDLPVRNCTFCHGPSAQGFATAPRLAGQRSEYIENQLSGFARHIRDNPYSQKYMWNAAANLSPQTAHDLAAYFSALPPHPANDGSKDLVASGKEIFELGIPTSNVVACIVCHAPNAEGVREIPRLGGLSYLYVKRRLEQWNEGFHGAARPMPKVARSLSATQIDALASYLSFVDK